MSPEGRCLCVEREDLGGNVREDVLELSPLKLMCVCLLLGMCGEPCFMLDDHVFKTVLRGSVKIPVAFTVIQLYGEEHDVSISHRLLITISKHWAMRFVWRADGICFLLGSLQFVAVVLKAP